MMNKVRAFDIESQRVRALDRTNQLFNTLQRARDTFLSIRNPGDDELVEKHMLMALEKIDGARFEASHIIRCLRNTGLALLIGLTLSFQDYGVDEAEAQTQRRSARYYYHSNPSPPPFPGSVPGGSWPNLPEPMPAIPPPPIYAPLSEREVIIINNDINVEINNLPAAPRGVRIPD